MNVAITSAKTLNYTRLSDITLREIFTSLLYYLNIVQRDLATAINANEVTYISQNAAPTVIEGQMMVWKDADATAGNPKAYIITMQGGVTYTFRSVEVV